MIVVDTSAFISLAVGDVLQHTVTEFDVLTTQVVIEELEQTADYDDRHGRAAADVLTLVDHFEVTTTGPTELETSRIDAGEASCVAAVRETEAPFLVTDDYRALPELQRLIDAEVALSPIVLRALVKRGVLTDDEAKNILGEIAEQRDWLGAPIYRYARQLLE